MDIQFCNNCENMTYLCIEDETNELVSKCKCCGNVSPIKQTSKSVYNMSNSKIDKLDIIKSNQYITHDITLPTIKNSILQCNKEGCGGDEITYIKYDDKDMKYAYICKKCGSIWKNNIKI